jgi:uncharacterized surface protein with fasciclin (FAS1) repeats
MNHPGKRKILVLLALLAGITGWHCNKSSSSSMDYKTSTISYILANGSNTSFFETAIREASLDSIFSGTGPFTVFVPTDDAFNLSGISLAELNNYTPEEARKLVLYHTVAGTAVSASGIIGASAMKLIMADGDSTFVTADSNRVFINGVPVTASDVTAANGLMHALQQVLRAPKQSLLDLVRTDTSLSFLSNALLLAAAMPDSLTTMLASGGPFTFFAPVNDAFRNLGYASPEDLNSTDPDSLRLLILSQLVPRRLFSCDIPDSASLQTVNDSTLYFTSSGISTQLQLEGHDRAANVIAADQMATNGVLFKTDAALVPGIP